MPFFSMVGSLVALIITMIVNPILYHRGILHNWKFGDSTVETGYNNSIDFYFSFGIGVALAFAIVGFYQVFKSVRRARRKAREAGARRPTFLPAGRGDFRTWIVVVCYFLVTVTYIGVSIFLLCWHHGVWSSQITNVLWVLLLLGFVYTPIISYVTARLVGMVGQAVEIPMIREASLILSGYRGVAIWFLPIPLANYGGMTVFYRQCELTGTRFSGIWKTKLILFPIILISSIFFMNFIWSLDTVPSSAYPMAQMTWELNARTQCITFSATTGQYSVFEEAWNWVYMAVGVVFCTSLFAGLGAVSAPVMLTYGVILGLGATMHAIVPQFIGALIGRYYFQKRFASRWRQYIPVVAAGYFCGAGLIATVGVGITFLSKAVIRLPF